MNERRSSLETARTCVFYVKGYESPLRQVLHGYIVAAHARPPPRAAAAARDRFHPRISILQRLTEPSFRAL